MPKYFFFLVFYTFFCVIKTQDGTPCKMPTKEEGLCVSVYSCKFVTNILSNNALNSERRSFVRSLSCGYQNGKPLVCCPQEATPRESIDPKAATKVNGDNEETNNESGAFLGPPRCGLSSGHNGRIVGGIKVKLGEYPWLVALGYKNSKNPSQPKWLCGGSLITMKHIITAGHCVYNRNDLYIARVGELDLFDPNDGANPVDIPFSNAKVHENYDRFRFTHDIAILTLSRTVEGIQKVTPICLPWQSDKRNQTFLDKVPVVAGWGSVYFNGPASTHLLAAEIPVQETEYCSKAFPKQVIDDKIICAGHLKGAIDACKGDSGGPLMIESTHPGTKEFYLIGIVSYGFKCAEAGYPGVYTRVTYFLDWIEKNID